MERKPMIHTVSFTILGCDRKMECFEKWLVDNLQVRGIYLIYSFFAHILLTIILFVSAEKKQFLTRFKHESPSFHIRKHQKLKPCCLKVVTGDYRCRIPSEGSTYFPGPVSRKSRKLVRPEKPFITPGHAYCVWLVF